MGHRRTATFCLVVLIEVTSKVKEIMECFTMEIKKV